MDIFNKKKVRTLEEKIDKLELQLAIYRHNEEKKEEQSKHHQTGAWCQACENLVIHSSLGCFPTQFCMLDNECKDRKPKG